MNDRVHIVTPTEKHTHTIIFLHGRDSNSADFCSELFESQSTNDLTLPQIHPHIKWVFPNSGIRKSERFGIELSQWFDMWATEDPHQKEELSVQGIHASIALIAEVIKQEARIVPHNRIFLGGISQGSAVAILTLLRSNVHLAGFVGFSTWLPFAKSLPITSSEGTLTTPVFLAHCHDDEVIDVKYGEELRDKLSDLGMSVNCYTYEEGGHWINEPQGIDDVVSFIDWCMRRTVNKPIEDSPCFLEKKGSNAIAEQESHNEMLPGIS